MACNHCETTFNNLQSVVVSINTSGSTAYLYVKNQGKNIVMVRRLLFCYEYSSGSYGTIYLRPTSPSWAYSSEFLEPGITALFYQIAFSTLPRQVQAQAEFIEIDGRSRSCAVQF